MTQMCLLEDLVKLVNVGLQCLLAIKIVTRTSSAPNDYVICG